MKMPIQFEDLKDDSRQLAELTGMETFLRIVEVYGGSWVYIPMKKSVTRNNRNEQIRSEFDGKNHHELSFRYGLSVSMIRNIVDYSNNK